MIYLFQRNYYLPMLSNLTKLLTCNFLTYSILNTLYCTNTFEEPEYIKYIEDTYNELNKKTSPPIIYSMNRSGNKVKFKSIKSNNNFTIKKSLYDNRVIEYRCYKCNSYVNTQIQGSFHALDQVWCKECWLKRSWEFQSP